VACEQRQDWQPHSARVAVSDALLVFESVFTTNRQKVLAYVENTFGRYGLDVEGIASEAWARMCHNYWGPIAHARFLALSRVSTFVCRIAHNIGADKSKWESISGNPDPHQKDSGIDPEERLLAEEAIYETREFYRHIEACMDSLPPRCRIVAYMVWRLDMPQIKVAEELKMSEANVSQHVRRARLIMPDCLRKRGVSPKTLALIRKAGLV